MTKRAEDSSRWSAVKNPWLAEICLKNRKYLLDSWIEGVLSSGIPSYKQLSREYLETSFGLTIDVMIDAFTTGNMEEDRRRLMDVVAQRKDQDFSLVDLEGGVDILRAAVLKLVDGYSDGLTERFAAYRSAGGMYEAVILDLFEVYQEVQARLQERFAGVYGLAATLNKTLDLGVVTSTSAKFISNSLHSDCAAIVIASREQTGSEVRGAYNVSEEMYPIIPEICRALGCGPEIVKLPDIHFACTVNDISANDSIREWAETCKTHCIMALSCVPLVASGQVLGSILIGMNHPHEFVQFETDYFQALAEATASAVQNAVLYEDAKGKNELSLLLEAGKLFAATLDLDEVLSHAARLAVSLTGGNRSMIFLPDEPVHKLHRMAVYNRPGYMPDKKQKELDAAEPSEIRPGEGANGMAFATGQTVNIPDYALFANRIPEMKEHARAMLAVPIMVRAKVVGVIGLLFGKEGEIAPDQVSIVEGLANQAGLAIENALLYQRQRNIADTFQRSFLPASLPKIPGYEASVGYRSALKESDVGGDFYDVFKLKDGRYAIVLADVSGKGLAAAGYTAMGKYVIRSYAEEDPSPASVLRRSNNALCDFLTEGMFITAIYAVLDVDGHSMTYTSAGHDQPMYYCRENDLLTRLDITGPGLGVIPGAEFAERVISFCPGDTLFIFTDGATDVRSGNHSMLGEQGLEGILRANLGQSAHDVTQNSFNSIIRFGHGKLSDDVAIITLRRELEQNA
jgi:serine phosphatase RsbU (regulator of sigma subunit)